MSAAESANSITRSAVDLVNHLMQNPSDAVSTEYVVDLMYGIAASTALDEGQKIEKMKAALETYRCNLLSFHLKNL
jgi:hypothetical protein